ncbi:hypothetical protein [Bacillus suaedae]|uniref:Uncharacterized protein n=1 Tax=Halalkalibacter suaedae TaxID=2822140 RepID=A0A941ATQ1_9BACI|nr:hypothetical protein [Bacillus suaedae]MBP3952379.1 hypothetical protein [Bacillus suaedae]
MQEQMLTNINNLEDDLTKAINQYWKAFSSFDTWQFWLACLMLVLPLIAFYFFVDRKKLFIICFFGYTYHVFLSYFDAFMNRHNFWEYPYFLFPFLTSNIAIDAALLPVSYLLLYQYVINNNKNFYLYSLLLSLLFAFAFAGALQLLGLFRLTNGMNNFYLLLVDYGLALLSYWLTSIFIFFSKQ